MSERTSQGQNRSVRDVMRRQITCMRVGPLLQSYLDGETDEVTARRVASHVEECRRCGLELRTYLEIHNALIRRTRPNEAAVARLRGFGESLMREEGENDPPWGA